MALELLFTFFLVFLNGFFVASEFAIVKVRASQLEVRVAEGHRAANLASHIVNHLDGYLDEELLLVGREDKLKKT